MKPRFAGDPPDSSDSFFDTAGAEFYWNFSPPARHVGIPLANSPAEIPAAPALTSEAAESSAAQSGPTSTYSLTSGGITINLLFDAAAMAAPASFRAGIQQAASILTSAISDKITVNIKIDYSGTGGGAAAGPDSGLYQTYSAVRADLVNNASPGDTIFSALPSGASIQGQSSVAVWNAQLKLWGVLGASDTTTDDGSATFATDINSSLLVGVALHELTHAMGRVPYGTPYSTSPDIFDFYRFSSPGVRVFSGASTASPAYFSVDGGNTKLADYGQISDPSDFLNSGVQGPNDPFSEFYSGSTLQTLTAADIKQLDALGFHTATVPTLVIEAFGSTSLVQAGSNFYLDSNSTGSGPQLKYGGSPVATGEFGSWTPIGAEQTASGYEVAWKLPGTDQYSIWFTDGSGNDTSSSGSLSGTSTTLVSLETSFHQDLNGDGTIGPVVTTTTIESYGSTSLVQAGSNFYLDSNSTGSGPQLKYGGSPVATGEFGSWTPIGAEQTASGYEVAWKLPGTDQYSIWFTDGSGNDTSSSGSLSGSSTTLVSLETSFHQDLNGDGTIGLSATAPSRSAPQAAWMTIGGHDTFVFAPNFGQITLAGFQPATDTLNFNQSVFANLSALVAAIHDDGSGNAVIADAAHDTITIQHVTTAQLLAHQGDFHFLS
jgi:serralysin